MAVARNGGAGMSKVTKNCGNCLYGVDAPTSMKPIYGYGGMMLVCTRPTVRKGGIEMVAPLHKCRCWLSGKRFNGQCEAVVSEQEGKLNAES